MYKAMMTFTFIVSPLQESLRCDLLAVGKSSVQCCRQLHKPKWPRSLKMVRLHQPQTQDYISLGVLKPRLSIPDFVQSCSTKSRTEHLATVYIYVHT